jgi:hypothetical protein
MDRVPRGSATTTHAARGTTRRSQGEPLRHRFDTAGERVGRPPGMGGDEPERSGSERRALEGAVGSSPMAGGVRVAGRKQDKHAFGIARAEHPP